MYKDLPCPGPRRHEGVAADDWNRSVGSKVHAIRDRAGVSSSAGIQHGDIERLTPATAPDLVELARKELKSSKWRKSKRQFA